MLVNCFNKITISEEAEDSLDKNIENAYIREKNNENINKIEGNDENVEKLIPLPHELKILNENFNPVNSLLK